MASLSTARARAQQLQDNKGTLAMKRIIIFLEKLRAKKTYKKRARMFYRMKHVLATDRR